MNNEEQCENKTVLVIDDDKATRDTIKDVLEMHGYSVVTAKNGEDGIKKLSSMKLPPCLILLDLMMPEMNGWGFLDHQKSNPAFVSIPVVICSSYEGSARSISKDFIIKPVQLDTLLRVVSAFCSKN